LNTLWYFIILGASSIGALIALLYTRKKATAATPSPTERSITPAILTTWPSSIVVGVLTPLPNEAAQNLVDGLTQFFSHSKRTTYLVLPLSGSNTRVSLFSQTQKAALSCDALVTYGITCANIASEAASDLKNIPIIKTGLKEHQLARLAPHSPNTILVTTTPDYSAQIDLLKTLKPSLSKACILYRVHHEATKHDVALLKKSLEDAGAQATTHVLSDDGHIDHQLSARGTLCDTLFVMPYTVTATTVSELVAYCMAQNITLCSQELDIVSLGGAVGFGSSEKDTGIFAGQLIRNINEGQQRYPPGTILNHNPRYTCVLNKHKCLQQGINLSTHYLHLLEHTRVVSTQLPHHKGSSRHEPQNAQHPS